MRLVELCLRFLVVGALAFGGGQAALPVVERLTVGDTGWLTPAQFAIGVGLAYATPGPVLILAAFVGYVVAGLPGALVATVAVFAMPVALAAGAAQVAARLSGSKRFRAFGRWAGAAAIGLLAVTLLALARPLATSQPLLLAAAALAGLAAGRGVSPLLVLGAAALAGALLGGLRPF